MTDFPNTPAEPARPDDPNPYASPHAALDTAAQSELPEQTLAWLLFSFKGRIPRRAYWGVTLAIVAIYFAVALAVVTFAHVHMPLLVPGASRSPLPGIAMFIPLAALYILVLWISMATQIKRWHDRDKSGWWFLIGLVPYIGGIWVLVECGCLRGTEGPNAYGPDPT